MKNLLLFLFLSSFPAYAFLSGGGSGGATTCQGLSNSAPSCSTDATNASNISSGTLGAARLPAPTTTAIGGVTTGSTADGTVVSANGSGGFDLTGSYMRNAARPNTFIFSDSSVRAEFSMDNIAKFGAQGSQVFLSTADWNAGTKLASWDTGTAAFALFGDINLPFWNFYDPQNYKYNVTHGSTQTVYTFTVDRPDALVTFIVNLMCETADASEYAFYHREFQFYGNGSTWSEINSNNGQSIVLDKVSTGLAASTLVSAVSGFVFNINWTNGHTSKTAGCISMDQDRNAHPSY